MEKKHLQKLSVVFVISPLKHETYAIFCQDLKNQFDQLW